MIQAQHIFKQRWPLAASFALVVLAVALFTTSAAAQTPDNSPPTAANAAFVTTWETLADGESITIPTFSGATYNYTVNWGDGRTDAGQTGDTTHRYAVAGTHTVAISGDFPRIYVNGKATAARIRSVGQWGTQEWTSMERAFQGVTDFEITARDAPDLAPAASMREMFKDASGFTGAGSRIGDWDVSNVTNMQGVFAGASAFNQDLSGWEVGSVTNMSSMFQGATAFNQDIGGWPVGNVTNMYSIFSGAAAFNQDIGEWDVSNVTDMTGSFADAAAFNQDIGGWNVSKVTDMTALFNYAAAFNQDIGEWNVSNVTEMTAMFHSAAAFNQDIGEWKVGNVTNMQGMFADASAFNQDLGKWDTSNVEYMNYMFAGATLSAANYDALLQGWSANANLPHYMNFHAGNSQYSGAAQLSRAILTETHGWTIIDGDLPADSDISLSGLTLSAGQDTLDPATTGLPNTEYAAAVASGVSELTVTPMATDPNAGVTVNGGAASEPVALNEAGETTNIAIVATASGDSSITQAYTLKVAREAKAEASSSPFITTWETLVDGESITIPTTGSDYDYRVDWGDGNSDNNQTGDATHSYATPGTYTVAISGDFPQIYLDGGPGAAQIRSVEQWGTQAWTSMDRAFQGVTNFEITARDAPDLTQVSSMQEMFKNARSFTGAGSGIGDWDVSNVTDLTGIFTGAGAFNQNIGGWNVEKVTKLEGSFAGAVAFNQDLAGWDVSNVTDMTALFFGAWAFNQDISEWKVGNVTSMHGMFADAGVFNQDLGEWDISNAADLSIMFWNATLSEANYDALLQGWSARTDLQSSVIFDAGNSQYSDAAQAARAILTETHGWTILDGGLAADTSAFITTWETSAAGERITIPTFHGATYDYRVDWGDGNSDSGQRGNATHSYATAGIHTVAINGDFPRIYVNRGSSATQIRSVEQWGTQAWTSMDRAFAGVTNFEITARDAPDLAQASSMQGMFKNAYGFTGAGSGIGDWDVSNVTDLSYMFSKAFAFNQDLGEWKVGNVTDLSYMFSNAFAFNQDLGEWKVSNVTKLYGTFAGAGAFNQDLSEWDVSSVTDLTGTFFGAWSFNQDIGEWDVSAAQAMNLMFHGAFAFNQDLGDWNISNASELGSMFSDTNLSVANYDALLQGWSARADLQPNVTFGGGNSQYSAAAQAARAILAETHGWTIIDRGLAADPTG